MREEHEHGKSEENNWVLCTKEIVGDKVCKPEVTLLFQVSGILPLVPKSWFSLPKVSMVTFFTSLEKMKQPPPLLPLLGLIFSRRLTWAGGGRLWTTTLPSVRGLKEFFRIWKQHSENINVKTLIWVACKLDCGKKLWSQGD